MGSEPEGNEASARPIRKLPNEIILLILACSAPFFLFFMNRGDDVRGFVAALSVCAVLSVAAIMRAYAYQSTFWLTLCAMIITHALFVAVVPWPPELQGPGIVFAPLVILDMYAWAKLLNVLARRSAAGS
jgi:hypothetical protein